MRDEIKDDIVLKRVVETLQELPPRNPALVARILAETAAAPVRLPWWRRFVLPLPAVAGLAAATLAIGVWFGSQRGGASADATAGLPGTSVATTPAAASGPGGAPAGAAMRPVGTDDEALMPVQFTIDHPEAKTVSVVGEFNDWNPEAAPLERDPSSGSWTTTIALAPGRHVYAFVVDGVLVADPRAPRAADDDFGRPGSVLLVKRP